MQQEIVQAIEKALQELGVTDANFVVERPGDFAHGDYATNAALVAAKELGRKPQEVAYELLEKISSKKVLGTPSGSGGPDHFYKNFFPGAIDRIEIAGPGFINFFIAKQALEQQIHTIATHELSQVASDFVGQKVMVEFTDPNPFKEFHIGHLMSNTIGESVARILEIAGAEVVRVNYQGDVGLHVAKAIWGKMKQPDFSWGKAYTYGSGLYEANKIEIDSLNKKIYEKSDAAVNQLYDEGRASSLKHFEELYSVLGTTFEHYFFESETTTPGIALVSSHIADGVFEQSDGAIVYKGEKVGLHTRVFINSIGLPTYETKDLGLLKSKSETTSLSLSITITASEQSEYFKVVLAAARELPEISDIANKTMHIAHGMMRFANEKMSSRKGNVITGESLLIDLKEISIEIEKASLRRKSAPPIDKDKKFDDKKSEQIAVGAIKYAVLKQGKGKDIVFDPEKSLSLEGDSGPYLQYALTRARSLLIKAEAKDSSQNDSNNQSEVPVARDLLSRLLIHFPEVVTHAAAELEPHYITTYLTELASHFNSWYANERVIGTPNEAQGLELTAAFAKTLQKGLDLLGIPAPSEM